MTIYKLINKRLFIIVISLGFLTQGFFTLSHADILVYAYHDKFSRRLKRLLPLIEKYFNQNVSVIGSKERRDEIRENGWDDHLLIEKSDITGKDVTKTKYARATGFSFVYIKGHQKDQDYIKGLEELGDSVRSLREKWPEKPISVHFDPREFFGNFNKEHEANLNIFQDCKITILIQAYSLHGVRDVKNFIRCLHRDYPDLKYRLILGVHNATNEMDEFQDKLEKLHDRMPSARELPFVLFNANGHDNASYYIRRKMLRLILEDGSFNTIKPSK